MRGGDGEGYRGRKDQPQRLPRRFPRLERKWRETYFSTKRKNVILGEVLEPELVSILISRELVLLVSTEVGGVARDGSN